MENWQISAQEHAEAIANASEATKKLYSRINQDFEPWQGAGITLEMVEHAYCTVRFYALPRVSKPDLAQITLLYPS